MFGRRGRAARNGISLRPRFEVLEERIALTGTPTVTGVAVSSTQWTPAFISSLGGALGGYSIPVGSSAQTAALPWNNIDQIKIEFSEDVNVHASDLSLTGINAVNYGLSGFFYDPSLKVATWTLSAPLTKDRLLIDLDANGVDPITSLGGIVLDGEWVNNSDTYATAGNGAVGGDFEFLLNVMPGEVNSTSQVTILDYTYTRGQDGKSTTSAGYNPKYDINGSGLIDSSDWQFVQSRIGNTLPSGNPAGTSNDAPTARTIAPLKISNAAIDHVISLWDNFGDLENGASGLTYSIGGNSNSSLFDIVSINQSTGQLTLNAKSNVSGLAKVTVVATDAGGIATKSTISVGVGLNNLPPEIIDLEVHDLMDGSWLVKGTVVDDQDVNGLIVNFSGVVPTRAAVYPDGSFAVVINYPGGAYENEWARTFDLLGDASEEALVPLGNV